MNQKYNKKFSALKTILFNDNFILSSRKSLENNFAFLIEKIEFDFILFRKKMHSGCWLSVCPISNDCVNSKILIIFLKDELIKLGEQHGAHTL
jgi:hypothetical protein